MLNISPFCLALTPNFDISTFCIVTHFFFDHGNILLSLLESGTLRLQMMVNPIVVASILIGKCQTSAVTPNRDTYVTSK